MLTTETLPNTPGEAFLGTCCHPLKTFHNHTNETRDVHLLHKVRTVTTFGGRCCRILSSLSDNPAFAVPIVHLSFLSDLSQLAYLESVSYKSLHNRKITIYNHLHPVAQRVKAIALLILNLLKVPLFYGKYISPATYSAFVDSMKERALELALQFGGESGLYCMEVVTHLGVTTLQKVTTIAYLTICAFQAWRRYLYESEPVRIEKAVALTSLLCSADFLCKATLALLALAGVGGWIYLTTGLFSSLVSFSHHNQSVAVNLSSEKKGDKD